jgi:tetratricopeptide (TPR) repeat protein
MERGELLAAFNEATSGEEALAALDAIAENGVEGVPLGELYERVADLLANEERYEQAVAAQRKALDHGFEGPADGREMLAWYLLKAEQVEEGEQLWETLLSERSDDPDLHLTAGVAYLDADRADRAAELLARAIELTLSGTIDAQLLREAASERATALERGGGEREAIDEHAENALARLERAAEGAAIAVPWFAEAEHAKAIKKLPGFKADWGEAPWEEYSRELDRRMRDVSAIHGRTPMPVPVRVDGLISFSKGAGLDPDWAETRARYADDHRDEALPWPPGRNDRCWCGSDAKYKRHCGA